MESDDCQFLWVFDTDARSVVPFVADGASEGHMLVACQKRLRFPHKCREVPVGYKRMIAWP